LQQRLELLGQFGVVPVERVKGAIARNRARVPEPDNLRLALPRHGENGSRLELMYPAVNGMRRRDVVVTHERGHRIAIDLRPPTRMSAQRFQLGAEQEQLAEFRPVQRFDTQPIADKYETTLAPIPQRDGEHADHALERRLDPIFGERIQYDFGVRMTSEVIAA